MTQFGSLIEALTDAGVEFIVVGGLAATAHGSSRVTEDVDVVYARSGVNLDRLAAALAPSRPYLRDAPRGLPFQWGAETLRRGLNFTLSTTLGDIDLFGELLGGGGYDALLSHTVELELFGRPCKCLDLTTLIRVKRAAGRPRDLDAIAELEALEGERDGNE